ncbi:MAG: hypothetical protein ACUVRV_01040 [Cyanobacteriota bacterium]
MTIDNTLLWVLIGTAGISLLTLVYVLLDEGMKRRRYERQKQEQAEQAAAEVAPSAQPTESLEVTESSQVEIESPTVSPSPEPAPEEASAQKPMANSVESDSSEEVKAAIETPETSS